MRKILIIALLALIGHIAVAQTNKYLFTYDNAGNRIGSTLTLKSAQLSSQPDSVFYQEELNARFETLKLKLYPNPTKGNIALEIQQYNEDMNFKIEVLDANGKKLQRIKVNSDVTNMNLNNYASGLYFLKLISGKQYRILKVIKQ